MRALGTREQPIVFRAQNLASGRWGGIEFQGPVPPNNASLLENCVITEAGNSGVRILDNDQVTLQGCAIRGNTSALDGGGLRVVLSSGSVGCFDCEIEGNGAGRDGGGVHATTTAGAILGLTDCRIRGNSTCITAAGGSFHGGGIWSSGDLALSGCSVTDNVTSANGCAGFVARGGGLFVSGGSVAIDNTVVSDNTATHNTCGGLAEGGGIYAGSAVTDLAMTNCLVSCNATTMLNGGTIRGSGLTTEAATTTITNCTIARNSNEGVRITAGSTTLTNCIVFANTGPSLVGTATVNYSCIQGGFVGGTGNIPFNPQFVDSGCQPEDFALSQTSPCIDAGDPVAMHNDACRPPGQGTARNDMGALGGSGNCGFTGPSVMICGAQHYGLGKQLPNAMTLDWAFTSSLPPYPGVLTIANGFPNSPTLLLLGFQAVDTPLSGISLLVDPASASVLATTLDAAGSWAAPLGLQIPFLVGWPLFLQAISLPASGSVRASNGMRIATCH
ncbi:MAG: right-handed parallel beta-helix repeat-containing protein [Planctomycetes bacterium]|nr:right-handed parallel beta-helix repeat-containing protein [Planctomycetota bacterium]